MSGARNPSNGYAPETSLILLEVHLDHLRQWVSRLEARLERSETEIAAIEDRINRAIFWLAIAASGIIFSLIRAKIGL